MVFVKGMRSPTLSDFAVLVWNVTKEQARQSGGQKEKLFDCRLDDSVYVGVGGPQEVKTTGPELASPLRKRTMTSVVAGEGSVSLTTWSAPCPALVMGWTRGGHCCSLNLPERLWVQSIWSVFSGHAEKSLTIFHESESWGQFANMWRVCPGECGTSIHLQVSPSCFVSSSF